MNAKTLERILILRTIIALDTGNGCGVPGVQIADAASTECDHDLLDELPPISRRGIAQKLNAMSGAGLVGGTYDPDHDLMFWWVTDAGRELAASIDGQHANGGVTLTPVECDALRSWNRATVKAVFPNADARRSFLASDVGQVMAKIAEGGRS